MARKNEKVVVRLLAQQAGSKEKAYRVEKLVNRVKPRVGDFLTEKQVEGLVTSGRSQLTVDVLAPKE